MYKSAVSEKQLFSWRSQDVLNQLLLEIKLNTAKILYKLVPVIAGNRLIIHNYK